MGVSFENANTSAFFTPHRKLLTLILITARKRSLGQGNIFTPVCHSVHRGDLVREGGCLVQGVPAPGVSGPRGGAWWRPPRTATAAGGTHPTGMHSCINSNVLLKGCFFLKLYTLL